MQHSQSAPFQHVQTRIRIRLHSPIHTRRFRTQLAECKGVREGAKTLKAQGVHRACRQIFARAKSNMGGGMSRNRESSAQQRDEDLSPLAAAVVAFVLPGLLAKLVMLTGRRRMSRRFRGP